MPKIQKIFRKIFQKKSFKRMISISAKLLFILTLCGMTIEASTAYADKTQIWIYTSIYKEFAQPLKEAFEKKNSGIEAQIFQGGSEKLQAKGRPARAGRPH